ncbi:MAG: prepilin-type N-terminal cleavage/methylation domain-containing protein [Candidatus Yanofskybacteria bacterium]|nr:prepilin-type N-terminal cleavage/methylation domain-containing protein [Candidatus Yanofskybacteria bacterium]
MTHRGFSIIEVLVALFVLTMGAGAAFVLATGVSSSGSFVKSQLTASYLAQEGIEIVRNIRDSNFLKMRAQGGSWDEGLEGCEGGCGADYQDAQLSPALAAAYLAFDAEEGFYLYGDSPASSGFRRVITVTQDEGVMRISVAVFWEEKGQEYDVEAYTELYNWIEPPL